MKPFISTRFPVTALSEECYKERKAGSGQTLTGLGKWWGRKPLILVRATLLGHLMPSSANEVQDMEIFLKILTMDEEGLMRRQKKKVDGRTFKTWSLKEKLKNAKRPEEIDGPSPKAWMAINTHLGTKASTLQELFQELSIKRFGEIAKVGDCFCGGGSIPFEAARMGLEAYASDLNPIACLLTWGALNIVGGGTAKAEEVENEQKKVYSEVEAQIEKWGIECSEEGWKAEYYLYCVEVKFPDNWMVPLAPSWVIGKKTNTVAILVPNHQTKRFDFKIKSEASPEEVAHAAKGTVQKNGWLENPVTGQRVQLGTLRGDNRRQVGTNKKGKDVFENYNTLRQWENEDVTPRSLDLFQERLYCIRWVTPKGSVYREPNNHDLKNEEKCLKILKENFKEWQEEGHIPSSKIEPGYNTTQPIRERGWTHWHHLFNPRQLIVNKITEPPSLNTTRVGYNSKICRWIPQNEQQGALENQAFNTLYNFCARSSTSLLATMRTLKCYITNPIKTTKNLDAKTAKNFEHLWITDPPYADAVNYDELSEFFLAWIDKKLPKLFPEWNTTSSRHQAVRGKGESFIDTISQIYANLREHTLPNGAQTIMFNHSSNEVWGEMTEILIKAGLEVTSLWSIRTETENASKGKGNYVQATYLIQVQAQQVRPAQMKAAIRREVLLETEKQVSSMQALNKGDRQLFNMSDFALAGKTSQMKVLTRYKKFIGVGRSEIKQFAQEMGKQAEQHVSEILIPKGFPAETWRELSGPEKFYISTLGAELQENTSLQSIQDASRLYMEQKNYGELLSEDSSANNARLMTPKEIRGRISILQILDNRILASTLKATFATIKKDYREGNNTLKDAFPEDLKEKLPHIRNILQWMERLEPLPHWETSIKAASELRNIAGRI